MGLKTEDSQDPLQIRIRHLSIVYEAMIRYAQNVAPLLGRPSNAGPDFEEILSYGPVAKTECCAPSVSKSEWETIVGNQPQPYYAWHIA